MTTLLQITNNIRAYGAYCGVNFFWNFSDADPNDQTIREIKTAQLEGVIDHQARKYPDVSRETVAYHATEGWKDGWRTLFNHESDHGQVDLNVHRPILDFDPVTGRVAKLSWKDRVWVKYIPSKRQEVRFTLGHKIDDTHYTPIPVFPEDRDVLGREVDLEAEQVWEA